MIETLKKFKFLIIIAIVLVVGFIAYTVYTNATPATDSAALQKTTADGSTSVTIPGTGETMTSNDLAKGFVDQLLVIQNIDLKIAFFKDPVFVGLKDNYVEIQLQPIGRPNPFAPIGQDNGQTATRYQDITGAVVDSTNGAAASSDLFATSSSKTTAVTTSSKKNTATSTSGSKKKSTTVNNQ